MVEILYKQKISLLGDENVGKTCIISQYVDKKFLNEYRPTLRASFLQKILESKELNNKIDGAIELNIWEIAGQRSYQEDLMTDYYIRGSHGCILVFDVTRTSTIKSLSSWKKKIDKQCGEIPFIVVGNKNDLNYDEKAIKEKIYSLFGENFPMIFTSAKTGENIDLAFHEIAKLIMNS